MKRLILSLLLLMTALSLGAQTDHFPNNNGTIVRNGYTYKYEMDIDLTVYNIENRFTGVHEAMKDGSMKSAADIRTPPIEEDDWTFQTARSIVQSAMNTLSSLEKSLVAGKELEIRLYVDTSTGKVCDVVFKLLDEGAFRYVPIEVYRKIELDLKEQLWFTLSDFGRKLNYGMIGWFQTIKFDEAPPKEPRPIDPRPKDPVVGDPGDPGDPRDPKVPIRELQSKPKPSTN